jgi:hypothetical protein
VREYFQNTGPNGDVPRQRQRGMETWHIAALHTARATPTPPTPVDGLTTARLCEHDKAIVRCDAIIQDCAQRRLIWRLRDGRASLAVDGGRGTQSISRDMARSAPHWPAAALRAAGMLALCAFRLLQRGWTHGTEHASRGPPRPMAARAGLGAGWYSGYRTAIPARTGPGA